MDVTSPVFPAFVAQEMKRSGYVAWGTMLPIQRAQGCDGNADAAVAAHIPSTS